MDLEPRAAAALGGLPGDKVTGPVFTREGGRAWHSNPTVSGSQLNKAFQKIAVDAGIERHVFLHMIRHSWASWHYAVNKDLKRLMADGAWESLDMADSYSHLAPPGMVPEILAFWGRPALRKVRAKAVNA